MSLTLPSPIPLCRPALGPEEVQAMVEALQSGWLTHGPKTTEFEERFARYLGVRHAVAMNSCSSALFVALHAHRITGEVLVPSFTFVASANAIAAAGATPVFVDIRRDDCNIDPDALDAHLTPRTEALLVVHFAGQCCEMDRIAAFAQKHRLLLVEDSAQTLGGKFRGRRSGSWGVGCFSFFPTKNITTGEGGMLTTNDDELASRARRIIAHGIPRDGKQSPTKPHFAHRSALEVGFNFRLSNILAAIGVEQMKKLDELNRLRREHSLAMIEGLGSLAELELPLQRPETEHVYQMFVVKTRAKLRGPLLEHLKKNGIEASVHFDPPVHRQAPYTGFFREPLPVTEAVANEVITLPMFPGLSSADRNRIVHTLHEFFAR